MRKLLLAPLLLVALLLSTAAPAAAITGGKPDGNEHPYGALLLVPGVTFCSGTLIAPDVVLTAGHCTDFWTTSDDPEIDEVLVSFAPQAAVDEDWNPVNPADWHAAHSWVTHPDYVGDDWPLTWDYGLLFLDDPVQGITPADLPALGLIDDLIGDHGQTAQRFSDVGYGQNGVLNGGGPPVRNFTWTRKVSVQRYAPGNGSVSGILHPAWFILGDSPSSNHGAGCGGDSGSGIFPTDDGALHDTLVAVHVGGYRLGLNGVICGRITALNMRVDLPEVQDWIADAIGAHGDS